MDDISYHYLFIFYTEVLEISKRDDLPAVIGSRFLRRKYKNKLGFEGYFDILFNSLNWIVENTGYGIHICDSEDIEDPSTYGDYCYWGGNVSNGLGFIFMESSHPWHFPHRAILYGPEMKITIDGDTSDILVAASSPEEFEKFHIGDPDFQKETLMDLLKQFDRPRLWKREEGEIF